MPNSLLHVTTNMCPSGSPSTNPNTCASFHGWPRRSLLTVSKCNWQYSNYPAGVLYPSYGVGPGIKARFLCGHHTLLAHAKLAKWYHTDFKGKGRITFKNSGNYFEPKTNSTADLAAVQRSYGSPSPIQPSSTYITNLYRLCSRLVWGPMDGR
jgi:hypothetical protein